MDKDVLRKFLKAGFVDGKHLYPTEEGTPQGGVISPILANMTLDGLECLLEGFQRDNPGAKVNLARYADDFIVTGSTQEICEEIKGIIEPFLEKRGVELSEKKTHITHIDNGFDFLGWNFRKYSGKLLIKPSKKSIQKVLRKVRAIIKDKPTITQRELIQKLNPILRGWRNYHNHTVAKKVFSYVDNAVFETLWRWARRRHKRKGKKWIKKKYWHTIGRDNWVFFDKSTEMGKRNPRLTRLSKTTIVRHPKLKLDVNPYLDAQYFRKRAHIWGARRLTGDLREVWRCQKGICPFCRKPILDHKEADIHHVWPRQWGGTDNVTNLVYLHKVCHKAYHTRYPVRRDATRQRRLAYDSITELGRQEDAIRQSLEKLSA